MGAVLLLAGCRTADAPVPALPSVTSTTPVVTVAPTPSATPSPTPSPRASPRVEPSQVSATPAYSYRVQRVSAADLPHSWRAGCPVGPSQLRLVTLPYRDFGGARRTGQIVVNARVVDDVVAIFRTLYAERFPIRSLRVVDEFGGSDDESMAADNTSGFNCRQAVGGSGWSKHAYGLAIDVNPRENPYVLNGTVLPPEGKAYTDRSVHRKGMAYRGSDLNRAFARYGWSWGGVWRNPDYQHFSKGGL